MRRTQFFYLHGGDAGGSGPRELHRPGLNLRPGLSVGPGLPCNGRARLAEELPAVSPGRLGPGPGAEPTAGASGLGPLPGFRSLFSGNTWVGGFTCLLPVTGSCASACYLNPRWAGPEELSVAARAQPGMCGSGLEKQGRGRRPSSSPYFSGSRDRAGVHLPSWMETTEIVKARLTRDQRGATSAAGVSAQQDSRLFSIAGSSQDYAEGGKGRSQTVVRAAPTPCLLRLPSGKPVGRGQVGMCDLEMPGRSDRDGAFGSICA